MVQTDGCHLSPYPGLALVVEGVRGDRLVLWVVVLLEERVRDGLLSGVAAAGLVDLHCRRGTPTAQEVGARSQRNGTARSMGACPNPSKVVPRVGAQTGHCRTEVVSGGRSSSRHRIRIVQCMRVRGGADAGW